MSFDTPFGRLFGVRQFCYYPYSLVKTNISKKVYIRRRSRINFVFVVVILSVRSVSSLLPSVLVNIYKSLYVTGDLVSRKETVAGKFVNRGAESENMSLIDIQI